MTIKVTARAQKAEHRFYGLLKPVRDALPEQSPAMRAFEEGEKAKALTDEHTIATIEIKPDEIHPLQIAHWVNDLDGRRWNALVSAVVNRARDEALS